MGSDRSTLSRDFRDALKHPMTRSWPSPPIIPFAPVIPFGPCHSIASYPSIGPCPSWVPVILSPPCHSERSEESHSPSSRTWRGLGFRGERDPSLRSGCQRAQASRAAVGAFGPLGSRFLSGFPMKNVGNDRGVGLRFLPCCRFLPSCRPPVILSEAKNPTRPQAAPGAG